jgi:hypothetical protein
MRIDSIRELYYMGHWLPAFHVRLTNQSDERKQTRKLHVNVFSLTNCLVFLTALNWDPDCPVSNILISEIFIVS